MRVLIINGPNLSNIGLREPDIYGKINFSDYLVSLKSIFPELEIDYYQSHLEGDLVKQIHLAASVYQGIVLNAGAYSHTSVAIRDAVISVKVPVIMVHISNIYSREMFRQKNYIAPVCEGIITGFGLNSYKLALLALNEK
jgi:3-dehydroquinate dehydratase II